MNMLVSKAFDDNFTIHDMYHHLFYSIACHYARKPRYIIFMMIKVLFKSLQMKQFCRDANVQFENNMNNIV